MGPTECIDLDDGEEANLEGAALSRAAPRILNEQAAFARADVVTPPLCVWRQIHLCLQGRDQPRWTR